MAHVSLPRLVSICTDAARRGCMVIRAVQAKREAVLSSATSSTSDTSSANALTEASSHGIKYKVDGDPRSALTEADGAAQEVILSCLRNVFGDELNIVGEEDEDKGEAKTEDSSNLDVFDTYDIPFPTDVLLKDDLITSDDSTVPLSSVTVYVDPMDGTREFVEGRLGNVQCLVGITVNGTPIGGIVGLPFPGGKTETSEGKGGADVADIQIVYALLGVGEKDEDEKNATLGRVVISNDAFVEMPFFQEQNSINPDEPHRLVVLSGDSRKPEKDLAMKHLKDICADEGVELDVRVAGGSGNKIMLTSLAAAGASSGGGNAILAVTPRGTCSWDTAAPTAVLKAALGTSSSSSSSSCPGLITDFYGDDLLYDGVNITNNLGVLASCGKDGERWHLELCKRLKKDQAVS